jgi:dipeptidyl aminopeptidase/acylaminoacyl peptidase
MAAAAAAAALAACADARDREERSVVGDTADGLVFVRQESGRRDLRRARLADGAVRPFLASPERDESWPDWSDAAGMLVYEVDAANGPADLLGWQPGEPAGRPLAADPARDERWPEWSPDGARMVFAWRAHRKRSGVSWVDVATGRESLAAAAGALDYFLRPSFDADGARLVAQRYGARGRGSRIWVIDAEGPHRLTAEEGWFEQKPFFTRAGDRVIFTRQRAGAPRQIAVAPPGGAVRPLAAAAAGADEHSARASPARDEVAFVSDRSGSRDVWLAPLDGSAARDLTPTPDRDEFAPRWSPDGERLVVTAAPPQPPGPQGEKLDPERLTLVVLDRDGRVLLETPGMMADWMPAF